MNLIVVAEPYGPNQLAATTSDKIQEQLSKPFTPAMCKETFPVSLDTFDLEGDHGSELEGIKRETVGTIVEAFKEHMPSRDLD